MLNFDWLVDAVLFGQKNVGYTLISGTYRTPPCISVAQCFRAGVLLWRSM
uniref:Uncharacterized protein n=1 Tax=Anguilla anguilla TaxID=7936 RepID=A0A0E9SVY0_ANGAN